ncbi:hypothetical protein DPMN_176714 [Dreissena polymorpha]|uniref:Uncharacterized protein n=1 Tax=Dreissena polymorpha TaxID=45954 RepID=A0A9D4E8W6_DREPO|nr:hypothetical protein DPMN_176714 [Dreissena polymorpha]
MAATALEMAWELSDSVPEDNALFITYCCVFNVQDTKDPEGPYLSSLLQFTV